MRGAVGSKPVIRTLFRLSALALIASSPLTIVGFLLHPRSHALVNLAKPEMIMAHIILMVAAMLGVIGLPGLYIWLTTRKTAQTDQVSIAGLLGFVLIFFALIYQIIDMAFDAFTIPVIATSSTAHYLVAPGGILADGPLPGLLGTSRFPLFTLGFLLFALMVMRLDIRARWGSIFMLIGYLFYVVSWLFAGVVAPLGVLNPVGLVLLQIGLSYLGWDLLREQRLQTSEAIVSSGH